MTDTTEKLVDIGANLTNRRFQKDLPQVLRRADEAGVSTILITGTSMRCSKDAIQLAKRMFSKSNVALLTTVGVHPHDAKDFDEATSINEMRDMIRANPGTVVAVGECGLDFNRDFSPRDAQERVFRAQVELACELQLPLFLHERDAHATFVSVLQPFLDSSRLPPVVVHCFTGTESELRKYISMGFYIGLTGFVCMDSRGFKLRGMAATIPTDKLMIETDAPFMYPYGNNVKMRCEPKDLRAVAQTLAACYHVTPAEIAASTTRNATRFFQLEQMRTARQTSAPANPKHARSSRNQTHEHGNGVEQKAVVLPVVAAFSPEEEGVIVLDGGNGEGGGQVLRISVGLASVFGKTIRVHSIRANRKIPGLRNQHVSTIQLAHNLSRSSMEGAQLNSTEIKYTGSGTLSAVDGGEFEARSTTGGSVSLMIQGSLPIMAFSAHPVTLKLSGGTHAGFSPPVDFMQIPLRMLLSRFGIETTLETKSRGFFAGEIGEVAFTVTPVQGNPLSPIDLSVASNVITRLFARVTVFGASADEAIGQQYVTALKKSLKEALPTLSKDTATEYELVVEVAKNKSFRARRQDARGRGKGAGAAKAHEKPVVGVLVVVETSTGGILSVDLSGKDTPDCMALEIGKKVGQMMADGVCVDEHLADNAIVYMALTNGTSRLRVPAKAARTSQHLETALDIVAQIAGAKVRIREETTSAVVEVEGIGFTP
uniref:RNA 3'-terminal phosphate cyclase domain-containing protein n=2 Tax=Globisporangium ultimum TaxID=2052682 RepID=K3WMT8_GLOUD|nr:TatD related DNase [Globisporangium ultimum]